MKYFWLIFVVGVLAHGCGEEEHAAITPASASLRSVQSLEERVVQLERKLEEQAKLMAVVQRLVDVVEVHEDGEVEFRGVNVRISNGTNLQNKLTGRGNLIIGYGSGPAGSHNLVMGLDNQANSYGAIVLGNYNRSDAPSACILSGSENQNKAPYAVILGGFQTSLGTDSNDGSVVAGGHGLKVDGGFYGRTVFGLPRWGVTPQWDSTASKAGLAPLEKFER